MTLFPWLHRAELAAKTEIDLSAQRRCSKEAPHTHFASAVGSYYLILTVLIEKKQLKMLCEEKLWGRARYLSEFLTACNSQCASVLGWETAWFWGKDTSIQQQNINAAAGMSVQSRPGLQSTEAVYVSTLC